MVLRDIRGDFLFLFLFFPSSHHTSGNTLGTRLCQFFFFSPPGILRSCRAAQSSAPASVHGHCLILRAVTSTDIILTLHLFEPPILLSGQRLLLSEVEFPPLPPTSTLKEEGACLLGSRVCTPHWQSKCRRTPLANSYPVPQPWNTSSSVLSLP